VLLKRKEGENNMEWIGDNWFLLFFAAVFIGMHFAGYGCCGHGKHGRHSKEECDENKGRSDNASTEEKTEKKSRGCCG
jgi:hypothetical protein